MALKNRKFYNYKLNTTESKESQPIYVEQYLLTAGGHRKIIVLDTKVIDENFNIGDNFSVNYEQNKRNWTLTELLNYIPTEAGSKFYIIIENLLHNLYCVSYLDIKMGKRQHGDDCSEEKRINMIRKCKMSSSFALGYRICGCIKYDINKNYVHTDKYLCRKFTIYETEYFLSNFFGEIPYTNIVKSQLKILISKLYKIITHLKEDPTMRLYSSSLFIYKYYIFDLESGQKFLQLDAKIIDFEHSTNIHFLDKVKYYEPDAGYIFGLKSIIKCLSHHSNL
ncbi:putative inositol polyphosphate kinase [Intoshia linei]|uniref:Kinase n=1 Tax=Intoshia linei TaxID=1819745 RepID=A0A177B3I3_9BILA|nr:putative inositol polyphosphate kinase [Intoshia linei]